LVVGPQFTCNTVYGTAICLQTALDLFTDKLFSDSPAEMKSSDEAAIFIPAPPISSIRPDSPKHERAADTECCNNWLRRTMWHSCGHWHCEAHWQSQAV